MTDKERKSREERLKKICTNINKAEKTEDAVTYLGSGESIKMERFSSGSPELDLALGGGWPRGRFIEVYGPESSGKTTACLHAIAEFQRAYSEEDVALIDTEFSFDEVYAQNIGVDTGLLLVHQPDNGEQAMRVVRHLIHERVGCIIVDSVAALTPAAEIAGEIGDVHVAQQARLMSQTMRILCGEAGRNRTTIFWTNQMRDKIGVQYGEKTTTPGGRALRHYASIRVGFAAIAKIKEGGKDSAVVGSRIKADVKKNKVAPPFRQAIFYLSFGTGIDRVAAVCDAAVLIGIVTKRGAKIVFQDNIIASGRPNFLEVVKKDEVLFKKLDELVRAAPPPEIETEDEDTSETEDEGAAVKSTIKKPKEMGGIKRIPVTSEDALPGDDAVETQDA